MEAETYLSSGYGLRIAIEERAVGWQRFSQQAQVTIPNRTKGTLVSPEYGTPFVAATQVFDIRPVPRKWLASGKIGNASALFALSGAILITRSGNVGRTTLATDTVKGVLCSDDLLRVQVRDPDQWGWVYAYLRSSQARAMMSGAHYGHIIKHLETSHLDALPIPIPKPKIAANFQERTKAILDLRNRAHRLSLEAEEHFERALGPLKVKDWGETGFDVLASKLFTGRRRLEATPYNPGAGAIRRHLSKKGKEFISIADAGFDVWLPGRFKRISAEDGIELIDSSAVFEINPDHERKIADGDFGDPFNGRVKAGWLLMARSGQTYGINGSVAFATVAHENRVASDDLLRIAARPDAKFRSGYLYVALSHPLLGRPLVKSLAYGSSIPHIDGSDLLEFEVVRLTESEESGIADLAEESASERARADVLERELAADAGKLIEKFLAGDTVPFVTTMPTITANRPSGSPSALPEHARVRLLRAFPDADLLVGATGTIVFAYDDDGGYEVEFLKGKSRPIVLTVEAEDVALADE